MDHFSEKRAFDLKSTLPVVALLVALVVGCSGDREIRVGGGDSTPPTSAAPSATTTPSDAPVAPTTGATEVTISEPDEGAVVTEEGFAISGGSDLSVTDSMWTAARGIGNGNASFQPSAQPCSIAADGAFQCPTQFVGGPEDSGKSFEVLLLLADASAAAAFEEYNNSDPASQGYPGLDQLPNGAELVGSVKVRRQ